MVLTDLTGGIGNQLFQYCAGRHLSYLNHTSLKLNTLGYETYKLHKYALQHFNIKASLASAEEVHAAGELYEEKSFNFDPDLLLARDNSHLVGYWQSEKYFAAIDPLIRSDLQIIMQPRGLNELTIKAIKASNSVSIHVRRGDYITNSSTHSYHGLCDLTYYRMAVQLVTSYISDPVFFVFSDDQDWAMRHLKTGFETIYVTHNNAATNYEDLRLMSACRHNIIANSSFSWWGAWLNTNPLKIVVAPQKWYNKDDIPTEDLIPDQWIKI